MDTPFEISWALLKERLESAGPSRFPNTGFRGAPLSPTSRRNQRQRAAEEEMMEGTTGPRRKLQRFTGPQGEAEGLPPQGNIMDVNSDDSSPSSANSMRALLEQESALGNLKNVQYGG